MGSFVFEDNEIHIGPTDRGIPTRRSQDYIVQKADLHPNDSLVAPGYFIRYKDEMIHCTYPNAQPYFSVSCKRPLEHVRVVDRKCFGLDAHGHAHVYPFNAAQATKRTLGCTPVGWCIVPTSQYIIHWNVLSLQATHIQNGTHKHLKGHYARITCGDATTSVLVTGDRTGHVCIWYVASWSCHHNISVSHMQCEQVLLQNDLMMAVRTADDISLYDVTMGSKTAHFETSAHDMQWCSYGLVVATRESIHVYKNDALAMSFPHTTTRLVKSNHNRVWSISRRKVFEFMFDDSSVQLPSSVIDWIRAPVFPCPHKHWPQRYLKILAMSATQWVHTVCDWQPPRAWFRHDELRNAIWDSVLDSHLYDYVSSWSFLSTTVKRIWYNKCEQKLEQMCGQEEYSDTIVDLLALSHRHLEMASDLILKWCWRHHGHLRLTPILMYFTDHDFDGQYMHHIAQMAPTPDAILCFTPTGATLAHRNGWFYIFIQWIQSYHAHYPFSPTEHMRDIYTGLLTHIYTELEKDTMHIPLRESGRFQSMTRLLPTHTAAYVRQGTQKGFVTSVEFGQRTTAEWCPVNASNSTPLVVDKADVWTFDDPNEPHTMLECALYMLNEDIWSRATKEKTFAWFESKRGAFLSVGEQVQVYGETLTIHKAGWHNAQRYIEFDSSFTISDEQTLDIKWCTKTWSYLKHNLYHLVPLSLKICHALSVSKQKIRLNTTYAAEIVHCMEHETVREELAWSVESCVTAIASTNGPVFIGSTRGIIYQYDTMACMRVAQRTLDNHPNPIRQLHAINSYLLSMCHQRVNVWDLRTGTVHMTMDTDKEFAAVLPCFPGAFWLVEEFNRTFSAVQWDIRTKSPIKRKDLTSLKSGHILSVHEPEPCVLLSKTLYCLNRDHHSEVSVDGDVTCINSTCHGICGGTVDGTLFTLQNDTQHIITTSIQTAITAISAVPGSNIIIVGCVDGHIYVFDGGTLCTHTRITRAPIHCLQAESLFTLVASKRELHLLSIVPEKAILTMHALNTVLDWSDAWKTRLMCEIQSILQPSVLACLTHGYGVQSTLALLDKCTAEYRHRGDWCSAELVGLLLEYPGETAHEIIRRVASFRGPRFDCAICTDEDKQDKICYITPCHHRFHQTCIHELVKKTPEYHAEMQFDYALSFSLKCPVCRTEFSAENVEEDTLLNKYLYIQNRIKS
jgi:hypothetical protein